MDIIAMLLRIDALLVEREIKKEDFYAAVPISDAAVSQWRTGKTKPSKRKIERMAEVLEVTPEYLEYGIKKAPTVPDESIDIMAEYMKDFTADEKADVLSYIKFVHSKREQ